MFYLLLDEKVYLRCENEAAANDNLQGLIPPKLRSSCRIIPAEDLTISMTKGA